MTGDPAPLPDADSACEALAAQARADLALLAYPDRPWVLPPDDAAVLDVLVVGGGQSGLGICAALRAQGVTRVAVLDAASAGQEGVWENFARMPELRTPKALNGLDLGLPALSVQRWFATRFGEAAWQGIARIPRSAWMDYLRWYRAALRLPVENGAQVIDIRAAGEGVAVETADGAVRLARLVVLATGAEGGGAWRVPSFLAEALPAARLHHSSDAIDFTALRGQRVGILGHGASAFDNAVAALQAGARSVDLCFRRERLPRVNPHRHIETAGLMTHYASLSDATRWQVARHFRRADQPPPPASFNMALAMPGFALHAGCSWDNARWTGSEIAVDAQAADLRFDHAICATGLQSGLELRPELRSLAPAVLRWRERYTPAPGDEDATLAAHPYLGAHYEFLARDDDAAWVSRVFAFNGASYLSQGPHSTSISGHKHALPRLVRGLTQRLFLDQEAGLVNRLHAYAEVDLPVPDDFETRHAHTPEAIA
jgi:cation diffusion facilitator CzcD-associated flavoprotein CzcO